MSILSPDLWPALLTLAVVAGMFATVRVGDLQHRDGGHRRGGGSAGVRRAQPRRSHRRGREPGADHHRGDVRPVRALVRTGALEAATAVLTRAATTRPVATLAALAGFTLVASAFMNNTPVVLILIPVATQLAARMGAAPSKLLIPLSYCAILGGVCTLIGTSTNLLVDGVAQTEGLAPFSLFEITPIALILAAIGLAFIALAAPASCRTGRR